MVISRRAVNRFQYEIRFGYYGFSQTPSGAENEQVWHTAFKNVSEFFVANAFWIPTGTGYNCFWVTILYAVDVLGDI